MRYVGIDLSTKTGLVIILGSEIIVETEIKVDYKEDPSRMYDIVMKVVSLLKKDDVICIEGFSYGSKGKGIGFQFGIGHLLRVELFKRDIPYKLVTPSQLKKFVTGKGNTSKENMILPIFKRWGYEHESDNVRDAFILAKIAEATQGNVELTKYQREIANEV